jgi:hypothetical protein
MLTLDTEILNSIDNAINTNDTSLIKALLESIAPSEGSKVSNTALSQRTVANATKVIEGALDRKDSQLIKAILSLIDKFYKTSATMDEKSRNEIEEKINDAIIGENVDLLKFPDIFFGEASKIKNSEDLIRLSYRQDVDMSGRNNNCGYYAIISQTDPQFAGNKLQDGTTNSLEQADASVDLFRQVTTDFVTKHTLDRGKETANAIFANTIGNENDPSTSNGQLQIETIQALADHLSRPIVTLQKQTPGRDLFYVHLPNQNSIFINSSDLPKTVQKFFNKDDIRSSFENPQTVGQWLVELLQNKNTIGLFNVNANHYHALQAN